MYTIDTLVRDLNKSGHKAEVLTVDSAKNVFPQGMFLPYEVHKVHLSTHKELLNLPRVLERFEKDFDIFHITDPSLGPYAGSYKKNGGTAKVVCSLNTYFFCTNYVYMDGECHKRCNFYLRTLHSTTSQARRVLSFLPRLFQDQFIFPNMRYIDHFYPDSPAVKKIYSEFGFSKSKMTVIPEIIDFSHLGKPPQPRSFPVEKDKFKLLFVGRVVRAKGIHLLLSAMEKLDDLVTLTVCGNGPELETLKQLTRKLNLQNRVSFEGYVDYSMLPEYFKTHDLFVHPGLWPEPFGRTIVESMYLGLPVLASNVGGPPWIIGSTGVTFERGDVEDLTNKLLGLVENPKQLSTLSKSGEQRAKRFDGKTIFKKQLKEYERLLSSAPHSD